MSATKLITQNEDCILVMVRYAISSIGILCRIFECYPIMVIFWDLKHILIVYSMCSLPENVLKVRYAKWDWYSTQMRECCWKFSCNLFTINFSLGTRFLWSTNFSRSGAERKLSWAWSAKRWAWIVRSWALEVKELSAGVDTFMAGILFY